MTIRLASASRIRLQLLVHAGISASAHASAVDEEAIKAESQSLSISDLAIRLADAKAVDISRQFQHDLVIGADQILALGDRRYDKPKTRDEARTQLLELRGWPHKLISAVSCARDGKALWSHVDVATLTMRSFSEKFLEDYLDTMKEDVTSSVGGYKLETIGVQLFDTIAGDYFTILGLPLLPLLGYLRREGLMPS